MLETDASYIMNIIDENNLSSFSLNKENSTISIANDLDDEMLYLELDRLNEELSKSHLNYIIEESYLVIL